MASCVLTFSPIAVSRADAATTSVSMKAPKASQRVFCSEASDEAASASSAGPPACCADVWTARMNSQLPSFAIAAPMIDVKRSCRPRRLLSSWLCTQRSQCQKPPPE